MASASKAEKQFHGIGRRKSSVASVYINPHKPQGIIVNQRPIDEYFGRPTSVMIVTQPLEVVGLTGKFSVSVNVKGGGGSGQAGAIRLALARALVNYDEQLKSDLRKAGFLTVDARKVERKKFGLRKARRRRQFSKR